MSSEPSGDGLGSTETILRPEHIGPYRLLSPLGAGGMGEVWKARDPRLNRVVAVKRLRNQHAARFKTEARAIAALNHPHICQIYDIGPDYLVLEYIDGNTLKGPISPDETGRLAIQIAGALEEAHKMGILHRDLKPGNILLTASGNAKLLDFGLAKMTTRAAAADAPTEMPETETGMIAGTLAWMSPEQTMGLPLDARSDIFSFGLVLYTMLSGRHAFSGATSFAVMHAIVHEEPPLLDAPAHLTAIIGRCLAKSPENRFQSMTEVLHALREKTPVPEPLNEIRPSIAVLPFVNMSSDRENDFFGDGLAEEIINALANAPNIKVAARTSSFYFRSRDVEFAEIGRRLGVAHILEGSVRAAGKHLRVTAQLIKISDGFHLWSERYDREITDVFAIQDEITQSIASALRIRLSPETPGPRQRTPNLKAYRLYLEARDLFMRMAPGALERFKECLENAIADDPNFALPYGLLGIYYTMLGNLGIRRAPEVIPLARAVEQMALRVDPLLPEAHGILAVCEDSDYRWAAAEKEWALALARVPPSHDVCFWHGNHHLLPMDRIKEAIDAMAPAVQNDPLNHLYRQLYALGLCNAGRWDEAETEIRRILDVDEGFPPALGTLGSIFAQRGQWNEALPLSRRAYDAMPWTPYMGQLAAVLVATGHDDEAAPLLDRLAGGREVGGSAGLSIFHALRGNPGLAAQYAEQTIDEKYPPFIRVAGPLLRNTPAWPDLMKRMNLPR